MASVKRKAAAKCFVGRKVPFLAAVLHHLDVSSPDPCIILRDSTGKNNLESTVNHTSYNILVLFLTFWLSFEHLICDHGISKLQPLMCGTEKL